MTVGWMEFFLDPTFRGPTIGAMLMCFASGLIGTIALIQKRSLVGETLAHAAYPGVVLTIMLLAGSGFGKMTILASSALVGAFIFSLIGLWLIEWLECSGRISSDAALCVILASFLGIGVLLASHLQLISPVWYRQVQAFLYGQAATMTDIHSYIYGVLALCIALIVTGLFVPLRLYLFDPTYAAMRGVRVRLLSQLTMGLIALAVVIGIRSVGVVLMAGMLIAPALAARQWTHRLGSVMMLSALFGVVSAFFGSYLSVNIPLWSHQPKLHLPTGPMILIFASAIVFFSLLFSPYTGWIGRQLRQLRFRVRCLSENLLKALWKNDRHDVCAMYTLHQMQKLALMRRGVLICIVIKMVLCRQLIFRWKSWRFALSVKADARAGELVRLHRLWEAYLHYHLCIGCDEIHKHAEEIEHILTPHIEAEILAALGDQTTCPHEKPIPPRSTKK